ncbi:lipoprotein insertase outer membrane protein LolB [Shewanella sp. 10N.7]|uniref:lipoprotein insertase outer membrane protein LolB n=1 Tax=Shewanella sp. 10N.7 TaxID=2885093 RepID=UPI001E287035|nr:lipoprotein insertase outer membrane protein LolB [Shewanella sp. 10N.7]MCC4831400.1 lipoprotein insertase outer membrane protein LolB [Shewanella sp. 10N.7]
MRYLTFFLQRMMLVCCLFLTACSVKPPHKLTNIDVNQASETKAWELQGKLAFRSDADKFSTNLFWFHDHSFNQPHDELTLTTVIGTTVLSLSSKQGLASIDVQGKTYTDRDPQQLISRVSGMQIPLNKLPLWITGQVTSDDQIEAYHPDGSIKAFTSKDISGDWQVKFMSYQQQSGANVPRLLQINRADVQIKIQINQWQALAPMLENR